MQTKQKSKLNEVLKIMIVIILILCVIAACVIPALAEPIEESSQDAEIMMQTVPEETTAEPETTEPIPEPESTAPIQEPESQTVPEQTQPATETTQPVTEEPTQLQTSPVEEAVTSPQETTQVQPETETSTAVTSEPQTQQQTQPATQEERTATFQEPATEPGTQAVQETAVAVDTSSYIPITLNTNQEAIESAITDVLETQSASLTDAQIRILQACKTTGPAAAGYCATWVSNVYANAGYQVYGDAKDMRIYYCHSANREELQPGMIIAVERSNTNPETWGYLYGHVGIYIGNGMVVDSIANQGSGIKSLSNVDEWLAGYDVLGTAMWGFPEEIQAEMGNSQLMTTQVALGVYNEDGYYITWEKTEDVFGYLIYRNRKQIANIRNNEITEFTDHFESDARAIRYVVQPYRAQSGQVQERVVNRSAIIQSEEKRNPTERLSTEAVSPQNILSMLEEVPELTKEELTALGTEAYAVSPKWMQALIGTTEREAYVEDPYLAYAWACVFLNSFASCPADTLYQTMEGWGDAMCSACGRYYGEHAVIHGCAIHSSYDTASATTLKCVYLAMLNRDYRIKEVDGMISLSSAPGNYHLYYDSPIYNCQVWG